MPLKRTSNKPYKTFSMYQILYNVIYILQYTPNTHIIHQKKSVYLQSTRLIYFYHTLCGARTHSISVRKLLHTRKVCRIGSRAIIHELHNPVRNFRNCDNIPLWSIASLFNLDKISLSTWICYGANLTDLQNF